MTLDVCSHFGCCASVSARCQLHNQRQDAQTAHPPSCCYTNCVHKACLWCLTTTALRVRGRGRVGRGGSVGCGGYASPPSVHHGNHLQQTKRHTDACKRQSPTPRRVRAAAARTSVTGLFEFIEQSSRVVHHHWQCIVARRKRPEQVQAARIPWLRDTHGPKGGAEESKQCYL